MSTSARLVVDKSSLRGGDRLMLAGCCTALATLVPVALYQTHAIAHLPDPPFGVFDSERITRSKAAHPCHVPDALLGLASFGATLALIVASRRNATARKVLGAKLMLDAGAAALNATRQVVSFGKLCSWCTGTALAAGVTTYAGRDSIGNSVADARTFLKSKKMCG